MINIYAETQFPHKEKWDMRQKRLANKAKIYKNGVRLRAGGRSNPAAITLVVGGKYIKEKEEKK